MWRFHLVSPLFASSATISPPSVETKIRSPTIAGAPKATPGRSTSHRVTKGGLGLLSSVNAAPPMSRRPDGQSVGASDRFAEEVAVGGGNSRGVIWYVRTAHSASSARAIIAAASQILTSRNRHRLPMTVSPYRLDRRNVLRRLETRLRIMSVPAVSGPGRRVWSRRKG